MKNKIKPLFFTFCIFYIFFSLSTFTQTTFSNEQKITKIKDIEYASHEKSLLNGDIYLPAGEEKLPGIVLVHGGAFVTGDKDWAGFKDVSREIASAGFVVFNINYRLANQGGGYPDNVADVNCAIRFLKANADKYKVDKTRIGIVGSSAGGYLSLMAGYMSGGNSELADCPAKDENSDVNTVVDYFGVTDLVTFSSVKGFGMTDLLVGKDSANKRDALNDASPVNHVNSAPPTLILHGTDDGLVPYSQSEELAAALKKAGKKVWLVPFNAAPHGFVGDVNGKYGKPAIEIVVNYLKFSLKNGPKCIDTKVGLFECGLEGN